MNKKIILVLILTLLMVSPISAVEKEDVVRCYCKGNDYLELTEEQKTFYVAGLSDMLDYFLQNENPKLYAELELKTKDMLLGQLKAVLDKYIKEHPEKWHYAAADLFYWAMLEILDG